MNISRQELFLKKFGVNLMKLRTERGVAPEDLAYELGLEISRVSRIERGLINTSIYNLYRFLKF